MGNCPVCGYSPYSAMYGKCPGCETKKANEARENAKKETRQRHKEIAKKIKIVQRSFKKSEEESEEEPEEECEHKNLAYMGTDYDSNGNKCNIMVCKDCDEAFMVGRPHP